MSQIFAAKCQLLGLNNLTKIGSTAKFTAALPMAAAVNVTKRSQATDPPPLNMLIKISYRNYTNLKNNNNDLQKVGFLLTDGKLSCLENALLFY